MSGGIRDAESLERALATGCRRVNLGTAALEDPEWTAVGHRRARRPHRRRARRARHDARRPRLDPGGRRPLGDPRAPRRARAAPATSSPTSPRTACSRGPTSSCCARSVPRTDRPVVASGGRLDAGRPRGDPRPGRRRASRAPSSARPSTAGRSPCPRRSTSRAARDAATSSDVHRGFEGDGRPRRRPAALRPTRGARRPGSADGPPPSGDVALMARSRPPASSCPSSPSRPRSSTEGGHTVEKQIDMAAVTLVAPDGERALPVFSSTDALAAWDRHGPTGAGDAGPRRPGRGHRALRRRRRRRRRARAPGSCGRRWSGRSPRSARGSRRTSTPSSTRERRAGRRRARRTSRLARRSRRAPPRRGRPRRRPRPAAGPDARARCGTSPPGWGSGSPPTASSARASTASPSASADAQPQVATSGRTGRQVRRFRGMPCALVALCADRPPFGAVCKRSPLPPASTSRSPGPNRSATRRRATPARVGRRHPVAVRSGRMLRGSSCTRHEEPFSCSRVAGQST